MSSSVIEASFSLFLLAFSATRENSRGALRALDLPEGVKEEIGINFYTVPFSFVIITVRTIDQ
jgi:TRAP-type C4-dicarboxylate transport system permease small subunit